MPAGPDLLSRIEFSPDGCWLWKGVTLPTGYGRVWAYGGWVRAHRFTFAALHGPIPAGKDVHHLCGARRCVNPSHLSLIDPAEHGRLNQYAGRTHCSRGHPYTEENMRRRKSGARQCRACDVANKAAGRAPTRPANAEQALPPAKGTEPSSEPAP